MIRIKLTSVMVDDQGKARDFYTKRLGFAVRRDIPMGDARWLTVGAADEPGGAELLLEPMGIPEARIFQKALFEAGIPATAFAVDDIDAEYSQLKALGVEFRGAPSNPGMGPRTAVLNDTCGNLIQLFQV